MADRPIILAMANPEPEIRPELAQRPRARLPHRHRPLRLSEPGQQLAVLSVHLPRRARLRRDDDQRGDEARRGARAGGPRAGGAFRARCARLRRGHAGVRPRLPDPARVRSAAHHEHRRPRWPRPRWKAASRRGRSKTLGAYREQLDCASSTSPGTTMEPVFAARARMRRSASTYAEGEDERVLRAAQVGRRRRHGATGADRPHRHHREPHRQARAAAQARRELRGA